MRSDRIPDAFMRDLMEQRAADRTASAASGRAAAGSGAGSRGGKDDPDTLIGQYRGTPERQIPSRSKRRHRYNQDAAGQVSSYCLGRFSSSFFKDVISSRH